MSCWRLFSSFRFCLHFFFCSGFFQNSLADQLWIEVKRRWRGRIIGFRQVDQAGSDNNSSCKGRVQLIVLKKCPQFCRIPRLPSKIDGSTFLESLQNLRKQHDLDERSRFDPFHNSCVDFLDRIDIRYLIFRKHLADCVVHICNVSDHKWNPCADNSVKLFKSKFEIAESISPRGHRLAVCSDRSIDIPEQKVEPKHKRWFDFQCAIDFTLTSWTWIRKEKSAGIMVHDDSLRSRSVGCCFRRVSQHV